MKEITLTSHIFYLQNVNHYTVIFCSFPLSILLIITINKHINLK